MSEYKIRDFKFPVEKNWNCGTNHNSNPFYRLCARYIAKHIMNANSDTFQFSGYTGSLKKEYCMIDAEKIQLVHWILRHVGYVCSIYDIEGDKNKK